MSPSKALLMNPDEIEKYGAVSVTIAEEDLTRGERILLSVWHTFAGIVTLLQFNAFLNCAFLMLELWPNLKPGAVIQGSQLSGSILAAAFLTAFSRFVYSVNFTRLCHLVALLVCGAVMVPVFLFDEKEHTRTASALLASAGLLGGIVMGALQSQSFALAGVIHRDLDQTILVQVGQGVAGVISFSVFTPLYEWAFAKTRRNAQLIILILFCIVALFVVLSAVLLELVMRIKPFQLKQREILMKSKMEENGGFREVGPIIKKSLGGAMVPAFTLFTTLLFFPVVGPLNWPLNNTWKSIQMGVYQLGDLVFKVLQIFSSFTRMGLKTNAVLTIIRFCLMAPFFMVPVRTKVPVLSDPAFLTVLMTFHAGSHAICTTNGVINCMNQAENRNEARAVASFMTMCLLICATIASFSSELLVLK